MSQVGAIALDEPDRALVLSILHRQLPPGATVCVFGSRAGGRIRRYSDLDLAIDAGRTLTADEMAELAEAFTESDLPWKVDLIDMRAIGGRFREVIQAQQVKLTEIGS